LQIDPNPDQVISGHLELLAAMGQDFAASRDIEETLKRALVRITKYLNAESGALFLLDEKKGMLTCTSCFGVTEITGLRLPSDQGVVGRAVQNNAGEIVRNAASDPDFYDGIDQKTGNITQSILCAPISIQDQRVGAIELINKKGADPQFTANDLRILETMAASAGLAILNARMAEALVEQERVRRELELAGEIQRNLLPEPRGGDFPVCGANLAARMVSGDFYDFFELPNGRVGFSVGDVSGKGLNAALLMAKTASLYRCLGKTNHHPGPLLARINAEICETATRGMFVTMVGGVYDPASGWVRLANAGHEPPLLHRRDGSFTAFPAEAPPLGITTELGVSGHFPEVEIHLDGGTLYAFTDGVTEGYLETGATLRVSGLKQAVGRHRNLPLADRIGAIVKLFNSAGGGLRDDVTILAVDDGAGAGKRAAVSGSPARRRDERLFRIDVPARPDRLKLLRALVSEVAATRGCCEAVVRDLTLAVDEACQNVIRHGYGGDEAGRMILEAREQGENLVFFLRDFAPPVDVSQVRPRDLDDVRPGGLGTHLMRAVLDDVGFVPPPDGGGNLLRMVKRIS
jgi:sigma-B regulation protein RsbU (phosphoserine phosphatase)